jgi:hypothetical protein
VVTDPALSDARGSRTNELTGVADRVVVLGVGHLVRLGASIHGHKRATSGAAAGIRSILFIKRKPPQNH